MALIIEGDSRIVRYREQKQGGKPGQRLVSQMTPRQITGFCIDSFLSLYFSLRTEADSATPEHTSHIPNSPQKKQRFCKTDNHSTYVSYCLLMGRNL